MTAARTEGEDAEQEGHGEDWHTDHELLGMMGDDDEIPDNPYDLNVDLDAGAHVSDEDLREPLTHVPYKESS